MNDAHPLPSRSIWKRAALVVLIVWTAVAFLAVGATCWFVGWARGPASIDGNWADGQEVSFLSLSSLFIAILALSPGLFRFSAVTPKNSGPFEKENTELENVANQFFIGMAIRLLGTVALFFFSSYQLDSSATLIAFWVLLWHAILLATEVAVLYRAALNDHAPPPPISSDE